MEFTQKFSETDILVATTKVALTKAFTEMNKELDSRHMLRIEDVEEDSNHRWESAEKNTAACTAKT